MSISTEGRTSDRAVICEMCGHEMRQLLESYEGQQDWVCSWCYAVITVLAGTEHASRPVYHPVNRRWEIAEAEGLPEDVSHAYAYFGDTLCGIQMDGMSPSPYRWTTAHEGTCQACKAAAEVIDGRWPQEKRDWDVQVITPVTDPNSLPF
ncbi:hypothetical protein [Streptomyces virginiae]|uniref:hypothetical protein n=1 Tax=Streptomyces virginiae TaxID=1961 RepID=UPI003626231C